MARIRSIHPGFFTDEQLVSVSMAARLLFIGIGIEADDKGIFEWKPVTLKMRIFPADNADVAALLGELESAGVVRPYEIGGRKYGAIRNFRRHQRPKTPNDIHPINEEIRNYIGSASSIPENGRGDRPAFLQKGENLPQMEDEGDKRETTPSGVVPRDPLGGRLPELLEALGITDETKTPGLLVISEPIRWVEAGCHIDLDIIPTLRSIRARGKPVRGWGYCSEAVFETRDRRLAPVPAVQPRHATGPPSAHPRKQTVGQQARDQLKHLEGFNATDNQTGYHDASDENAGFAGSGIARRIAIAASR